MPDVRGNRGARREGVLSSLGFRSAAYAVAACAALLGLEGWNILADRNARLQAIETVTTNTTRSLVQHTEDMLDRADTVLAELVERVGKDGTGTAALARLDGLLRGEATRPPGATAFFVYDADGRWLASSLPQTPSSMNNVDRDYFRHHRESADPKPYVGPLIRSRSRATWILTISRRLEATDGHFAGVVLATIDATYFARFFSGFDLGHEGAAALFRTDGTLLARSPFIEAQAGQNFAGQPLFQSWLPRSDLGSFRITSPFDGVIRRTSYRKAGHYPIVIAAALSEQEALAPWYREVAVRLAVALILAGLLAILGLRLARHAQRRHDAERALSESEANFRLLAENSSDMVTRIGQDGVRRYVSPAAERLLGRAPSELVGRPADEDVHSEDRPGMQSALAKLTAGETREVTVTYRALRLTGQELWLESSVRVTHDPKSGEPDGVVAVTRDVTERRRAEERLAILATQDGLTGLANRRVFDETLGKEWRRAVRSGEPLCLLLLDIDRFKVFNDTYGHQGGDACLRAVAEVVGAAARRPADLAARYGGEELALLLPNTTIAGAMDMAEALRAALEAKQIPHVGNQPSGVVTASTGVAGITPQHDLDFGAEALVAAADGALYAAKSKGRNRVILAATVPPPAQPAPAPANEEARLDVLHAYEASGALQPDDPELDRITRLAARMFNVPVALLSLVGRDRQTFVSKVGLEVNETSRDSSFCAHALNSSDDLLVVPDAAADARFAANPLVTGETGIRFYAGAPLTVPGTDHRLGMLCLIDRTPRTGLDKLQEEVLKDLAALAISRLEQRRQASIQNA
jgi:diguanylate cyclase (GGDEF)-like protein/PAS domain S-box-containing protein